MSSKAEFEKLQQDWFARGWVQAEAEIAAAIGTGDYPYLHRGKLWAEKLATLLEETKRRAVMEKGPDRWEVGFRNIVTALIGPRAEFEIPEVVERVKALVNAARDLPLDAFDKDWSEIDAAEFVDHANDFMQAMAKARAALALARGEEPAGGTPR